MTLTLKDEFVLYSFLDVVSVLMLSEVQDTRSLWEAESTDALVLLVTIEYTVTPLTYDIYSAEQ